MNSCASCKNQSADLLVCSRCKHTWYCGPQCQRAHWSTHKRSCSPARQTDPPAVQLDLQTFSERLRASAVQYHDDHDEFLELQESAESADVSRYVHVHPWPNKTIITRFMTSDPAFLQAVDPSNTGLSVDEVPKPRVFLDHTLAHRLWRVPLTEDYIDRMVGYRRVGWHIHSDLNTRLGLPVRHVKWCQQFYFYLFQNVLCGSQLFPGEKPQALKSTYHDLHIAWNGIGQWEAQLIAITDTICFITCASVLLDTNYCCPTSLSHCRHALLHTQNVHLWADRNLYQ